MRDRRAIRSPDDVRAEWIAARVACALAVLTACGGGDTAAVEPGPIAARVVARAQVEARAGIAQVSAPSIGRVIEVRVDEGERVAAGDTLALVDSSSMIDPEPLVAPVAGVVIARRVDVGDDVSRADGALFEIADPDAVRLRFELEDEHAGAIAVGAQVIVTAPGSTIVLAETQVARLAARMEPRAIGAGDIGVEPRRVRAGWAELEPDPALPLGREVEVAIALPCRDVPARVPRDAIAIRDGRAIVRAVGRIGDEEVTVRIGAVDADFVEIEGVPVGTRVRRGRDR